MAANPIPPRFGELMELSVECISGAGALESSIPLVINTADLIQADRSAALTAQGGYESTLAGFRDLRTAVDAARADARVFATSTRDWLENFLGRSWNQEWRAVGFDNNSIAIPQGEAGLMTVVERMGIYLSSHTAQQNVALNITAARAVSVYTALCNARTNINAQCHQCEVFKAVRTAAVAQLGRRLRGLCNELLQRMGRSDPRWREFGLNIPAALTVPAVPQNVSLNASTPGQLLVTCAPSAHASYYRFFAQRVIVDPEPVFVGRSDSPLFLITNLAPGATYEVYVSGANASAESRFSEPARAVVTDVGEVAA